LNTLEVSMVEAGWETADTATLISRTHLWVSRRVSEAVASTGYPVKPSHGAVFALLGPDGSRLRDLADAAQVSPQAMGELVDELEKLGYVVRRPDPSDRRAKLITLTAEGRECAAAGGRAIAALRREIDAALGVEGHEELRRMLLRLLALPGDEAPGRLTTRKS
jgi:DNA-binding MarR family transcriptional regulator